LVADATRAAISAEIAALAVPRNDGSMARPGLHEIVRPGFQRPREFV